MSSVLLDINIVLDIMVSDRPGSDAAIKLIELAESGKTKMHISAGSLKDIYYVCCKYLDEELVRDWIRFFLNEFSIKEVDQSVCEIAIDSDEPDFEDGIIATIAEIAKMDFILTRDVAAFKKSEVRPISVETFLDIYEISI